MALNKVHKSSSISRYKVLNKGINTLRYKVLLGNINKVLTRPQYRSPDRQEYYKEQDHRITPIRPPPYMEKAYTDLPQNW